MEKPVRSSFQYLSISYECALAIGNSLNLSEMLHKVIYTMVHKTNAHRGIIWVKNGEKKLQPVASAGINIEDVLARDEIKDLRDVLNQIQKSRQFVLRNKDDKDFLQYCPVLTEKEESVLIVPVTDVAILHLVYAGREIADEPLANLLAGLSKKLSVSIEACTAHKNIINEVRVRVEAEEKLKKKTEQLISSKKELQRLYGESEHARKSLQSILEDVTQKEEALRESEKRFRTIFNSINDAVFIHDVETGAILDVNSTMCEMYGYSRKEVDQLDIQALSSGEVPYTQQDAFEWIKKTMAGKPQVFEWIAKHKSGHLFWVEISMKKAVVGLRERLLVVARDITERKLAAEALRESEERLKTILDSIQTGIVIIDAETHIIVDANPAAIKMIRAPKEQVIGHVCHDYICPAKKGKCPITDFGQKVNNAERILLTANREEVPILKTVTTMFLGGKECLLDSFIDIREKKKLEAQLAQSQKMEAIGTLAGGVAHDFNNLLTVIIGNAELALMDVIKDKSLRTEIKEIKKAGERAASLTRQLLAFSRKQIVQPKILDINASLTDIEKMLSRLIGDNIELLTISDPALWRVEIDPGQIDQIIINMVVNARDAMPQGGKLTIETDNVELDDTYFRDRGVESAHGPYVMLAVSDTGSGMDKKTLEHIFEPFFTTKEVGKGTGLGMSTVYGIIKQNNGFIWVYSEPGQGSTFKVYLPKIKGAAEPEGKEQSPVDDLSGSGTVLIVEDNEGLRKLAQEVLQNYGYRVLDAENGEDALRASQEHNGPIHLLLTDVVMPKMGGKKLAERLQPLYPRMKVIYMSGYTDNAIVHHGVLAQELNFLEKPFTPEGLGRKVREALESEN